MQKLSHKDNLVNYELYSTARTTLSYGIPKLTRASPFVVADRVEELHRLHHSVHLLVLGQDKVVAGQRDAEDDGGDALEAVDPLLALGSVGNDQFLIALDSALATSVDLSGNTQYIGDREVFAMDLFPTDMIPTDIIHSMI